MGGRLDGLMERGAKRLELRSAEAVAKNNKYAVIETGRKGKVHVVSTES